MTINEFQKLNDEFLGLHSEKTQKQLEKAFKDDALIKWSQDLTARILKNEQVNKDLFYALLVFYDRAYRLNKQLIDDFLYDQLEAKYEQLYGEFTANDDLTSELTHIKLPIHAYSLKKAHPEQLGENKTLDKFLADMLKIKPDAKFIVEQKLDGSHFIAEYDHGALKLLASRGDGIDGNDVTFKAKFLKHLPLTIPDTRHFVVEGEVLMDKQHAKENDLLTRNGANTFATQKDTSKLKDLGLFALAYNVTPLDETLNFETELDQLNFLKQQGFKTFENLQLLNADEVRQVVTELETKMNDYNYDVDGSVVKPNDLAFFKALGHTQKAPRWQIACKMNDPLIQTVLYKITPTVGKTGKLGFIGSVVPINFGGTMVNNVTLNNPDMINKLGLHIGSVIEMKRSGGVIPKIERVVYTPKTLLPINEAIHNSQNDEYYKTLFNMEFFDPVMYDAIYEAKDELNKSYNIATCPSCNSVLVLKKNTLMCANFDCPEKAKARTTYFLNVLKWNGIGNKAVETLHALNWDLQLDKLFDLIPDDWSKILNSSVLGQKVYDNGQKILQTLSPLHLAVACGFGTPDIEQKIMQHGFSDQIPDVHELDAICDELYGSTTSLSAVKLQQTYQDMLRVCNKDNWNNVKQENNHKCKKGFIL